MKPPCAGSILEVLQILASMRQAGYQIGLVPTMGALHAGHGALIDRARHECDYVVVSIFVNPIQFERRDDFEAYTIDLASDLEFCGARGADLVFAPSAEEMHRPDRATYVEVTGVSEGLCGRFRPGHFRGVATVVSKLFHIVAPGRAYFGEKDAQQLAIVQRMVLDLNFPIEIVPVATVREADGLALSSRNRRLSAEERRIAPLLYQALEAARKRLEGGCDSASEAIAEAVTRLNAAPGMRVEYLELVDALTMAPVERISGPARIAAAVWLGNTRLIDNVAVSAPAARYDCGAGKADPQA
jgi:pantoate--beta-alanine ligase